MSRPTIKLAIHAPADLDAAALTRAVVQWAETQSGGAVQLRKQSENDDYYRTRTPEITFKSRQVEGARTRYGNRTNRRTGEGHIGGNGELLFQREGTTRHNLRLPYLSKPHATHVNELLSEAVPYDLSVEKERTQCVTTQQWYVNMDYVPSLADAGSTGYYLEIQCEAGAPAHTRTLAKSLQNALKETHPEWTIVPEPRTYRELKAAKVANDPLRIARENTWLHAMTKADYAKLERVAPVPVTGEVLSSGISDQDGAFIVHSGVFDVYMGNRRVRSLAPGEVFGDVGPLAQQFGFVKPLPAGSSLRFGTVKAREGTDAKVIPIRKELLEDMCRSGALNGFKSIIQRNVSEWRKSSHDPYISR